MAWKYSGATRKGNTVTATLDDVVGDKVVETRKVIVTDEDQADNVSPETMAQAKDLVKTSLEGLLAGPAAVDVSNALKP